MAAISQAQCVVNVTAAAPAARSRVALRASFSGKSVAAKPAYFAAKRQSVLVRAEEKTAVEKVVEKKEEAPWSPPKLNPNTPSPIFGGSTGGLLRKAQVRARFRRDLPSRLPSRWNIARLHRRSSISGHSPRAKTKTRFRGVPARIAPRFRIARCPRAMCDRNAIAREARSLARCPQRASSGDGGDHAKSSFLCIRETNDPRALANAPRTENSPTAAPQTRLRRSRPQVEEFYVLTWETPKEMIFEMQVRVRA